MVTAAMKLRHLLLESKAITNLDSALKSRHHFATMVFPLVLHRYESWTERRLSTKELMLLNCGAGEDSESPLDCKEIKPVNSKGNQS